MPERFDLMIAQLCWVIQASAGGKADIGDFLPSWWPEKKKSPREMWEKLQAFFAAHTPLKKAEPDGSIPKPVG